MILIVNTTSDTNLTEELKHRLDERGTEYKVIECSSLRISHCIGCNYCWLKTPGVCTIKDDYEIILKDFIKADQMWLISDTALGFLDHKGKNIFDRILPLATMYLKFSGDQMRHVSRYDRNADIGLIVTGEAQMDYLDRWNRRAALNFDSKSLGVFTKDDLEEAVSCM